MAHGDYDTVVLPELGHASWEYLVAQGYQATWKMYPMAHGVCAAEIQDIAAWLVKVFTPNTPHASSL